jgi:membrane dipeptidase
LNNISRNVPDNVLDKIGRGHGKVDGVVMVKSVILIARQGVADGSFYPAFAAPKGEEVGVSKIADHIEHIADRIGRHQYATSSSGEPS